LSRYTPVELFLGLDAAVASAGYNTFHELMFAGVPTVFLPLPRIADDQAERARRAEAAGAARIAPTLEAIPDLLDAAGSPEAARALVPRNGARAAAFAALGPTLPPADLAMAAEVLSDALLGAVGRFDDPKAGLDLVRLLAGGTPSEQALHAEVAASLRERGVVVGDLAAASPAERIAALVDACDARGVPLDLGARLVRGLARKFPAARGEALLRGTITLLGTFSRFDDWMGALTLLRAVPTQRALSLDAFADGIATWLAHEDDLFDALRAFAHLEGDGRRPVGEVLALLANGRDG
jgi:hypothetical protein